jgi:hypothetical protein
MGINANSGGRRPPTQKTQPKMQQGKQQPQARESLDAAALARFSTNPRFGKLCGGRACAKPL